MSKQLILIDGSSYLFRAYHALPQLTTSTNEPTGAIYGVVSMIKKLMQSHQHDYIAVVFDAKEKTFRHKLYPNYKANRTIMPDELQAQILPLFSIINAMGLPLIICPGIEADDIIGTLAVFAEKKGIKTLISTMDKDMAQLVNAHITLINTMSDRTYDTNGVKEKFGVLPKQMIDYLALVGDTSDNIPGIPKVGPKTAANWLEKYHTLDNIIKHKDDITGKVGESLRENISNLSLSKKLVTIDCEVPLKTTLKDLEKKPQEEETLYQLFSRFEFSSWLKNMNVAAHTTAKKKAQYHAIQDKKSFDALVKKLSQTSVFSFDTETTDIDAMRATLVGMSFCITPGEAFYIPLKHDTDLSQLDFEMVLQALKPILENPKKNIIGQNLKYDYKILKNYGITLAGTMQDTMLESYVLNSTASRHDLDTLALKYLSHETITFEAVAGSGAKQLTFDKVSIEKATEYAAEDADVALQLHQYFMPKIHAEKNTEKVLTDIEWPMMPILAEMEYHGVLIDTEKLHEQSCALSKRIHALEKEVHNIAGQSFNLASPKQLQAILFEQMKLPIVKKTPTGAPSTDEAVMQELALEYEFPKLIVEYRQLSKLKSTYTDALPQQVNPKTHRVHTSYNQAITSTGRLSSNNPNLQNIPIRTEEGRKIRQAFIAPKNCKLISADYSQIELRIMAHLSKDTGLLSAFERGQDVHASTASEIFGVDFRDVTSEMRRRAKAINFGLLYGMSPFGLSKQLGISREEAKKYMDTYFSRYPKVREYMTKALLFAMEKGYVETLLGRRLYISDIRAANQIRRSAAERAAINAPLQGTAAEIIKLAMIRVNKALHEKSAKMIMQVHDELVFEVDKKHVPTFCNLIKEKMEDAFTLDVPLEVAIGAGDNWDEAH